MKAPCVLGGLVEPRLVSALPGLKRDDQGFSLDAKQFACCEGSGCQIDLKAGITKRCDLKPRLAAVSKLLSSYGRWCDFATQPLTAEHGLRVAAADLKILAEVARGASVRGRFVDAEVGKTPQRQLWSVALAGAWRFGMHVHVVSFGKTSAADLVPKPLPDGRRGIIVVERVQKLSDPIVAEQLEALINYAYGAGLPLWLEVWRSGDVRPGAEAATRSVARRVADAKNRPPLAWLTEGARRKLAEVCSLPVETMKAAERQKAGRSRPDDVKLPWE